MFLKEFYMNAVARSVLIKKVPFSQHCNYNKARITNTLRFIADENIFCRFRFAFFKRTIEVLKLKCFSPESFLMPFYQGSTRRCLNKYVNGIYLKMGLL